MASQFLPVQSFGMAPASPKYNGYQPASKGGFAFRQRLERVDWRKIASVDVEHISRTLDFATLQENIMNITFCNLEAEVDIRSIDPNFVKIFKLAQLTIEYLLHSQEYLTTLYANVEEKSKETAEEIEHLKAELETAKKEITEVKKESHKRKKLLIAQQQLMYAGNESYNKCPYCAKAFLNNSYLQGHIARRHGKTNEMSSVSPDLGVGSDSVAVNVNTEIIEIKERLLKQEAELFEERRALNSLKNKTENKDKIIINDGEEGQAEEPSINVRTKEIQELNAKLQASQRALRELESRTGARSSNLGELEDDIDENEIARGHAMQIENWKGQLQEQLEQVRLDMEVKLKKQDNRWKKRVHEMTHQHASEIKKLNDALESTSRSVEGTRSPRLHKQQLEVEELLRRSLQYYLDQNDVKKSRENEKALEVEEQMLDQEIQQQKSEVQAVKMTQSKRAPLKSHKQAGSVIKRESMYPSEDDTTAFGTGTSSFVHTGRETEKGSTYGNTGSLSLHTNEFLDRIRNNPTLGVMRNELAKLLEDNLDKMGIPHHVMYNKNRNRQQSRRAHSLGSSHSHICPRHRCRAHSQNQTSIPDHILQNKLSLLKTQRHNTAQKYKNFASLRQELDREATDKARDKFKDQIRSVPIGFPPSAPRRKLDLSPHTPRQRELTPRRNSSLQTPQQPNNNNSSTQLSPRHRRNASPSPRGRHDASPSPRGRHNKQDKDVTPKPQPRAKTPLSTGSTTEWTSTQYDSADTDSQSDKENDPVFTPSPGARLIQSGPGTAPSPSPRMTKPRLIVSKPKSADDDLQDILDSDHDDRIRPGTSPGKVASLTNSIQNQLQSRKPSKPFGGIDVTGGQKKTVEDFDESDWDETTANQPVVKKAPLVNRASTDGMSTNTYGTSAWGSSSKVASTVKDKDRRSTSRSSFVSVTDVSSDEDMNVDNI